MIRSAMLAMLIASSVAVPACDVAIEFRAVRRIDSEPSARMEPRSRPLPRAPAGRVDPGVPGPYLTISGEYRLPAVRLPHLAAKVEMRAVVVAPAGPRGPRPLVLFLHGRHETCARGAYRSLEWPCPAGTSPIPSFHGYRYAQRLLASQGYLTVSIAANGVNGQDEDLDDSGAQARSTLIRLHLAHWADWSGRGRAAAPAIVRESPRADLSRVLLIGHSRGGEGVEQAALDSVSPPPLTRYGYSRPVRWTIRGVVLIAPTSYNQNPAPDVPSVSILPGCDGDVSDLAGQTYVDGTRGVGGGTALHSAVFLAGANHNYFSSEWKSDDFGFDDDPICSSGTRTRLSANQQRTVASTYIAAAARLFVAGDDRVRPLLDGTGARALSADPAVVHAEALGAGRTPLVIPDGSLSVAGARLCTEVTADPAAACLDPDDLTAVSPHFAAFFPVTPEAGRRAVDLTWSAAGQAVSMRPARPASVAGDSSVALRIIVPPNTTGTRLGVTLIDRQGRHADLGDVTVDGLPATGATAATYWGQEVRVPLAGARGLDLTRISELRLVPRTGSGRAWLLDAWGWRAGTPAPRPVALPRIDLGAATVAEGGAGRHTAVLPVSVTGRGTGQVRLWVAGPGSRIVSRLVTVHPGDRTIPVPVTWTGDARWGGHDVRTIEAKAVRGVVVGDARGSLTIRDDDPMPTLTATPISGRVAEGGTLAWRIALSAPTERPITVSFAAAPPMTGRELSTADVDPGWLRAHAFVEPRPARPLSQVRLWLEVKLGAAKRTANITIPTVADHRIESSPERIRLIGRRGVLPGNPELAGTVTDG